MDYKQIATLKLRECDLINEQIRNLKLLESKIRLQISNIKTSIENENTNLIGKKALCQIDIDTNIIESECICKSVRCSEDFTIVPLFYYKGHKCYVNSYEWIK